MNLITLIEADGGTLRKVAATNGGEYSGACPFCGGTDRFRVWPENDRYWCRSCGQHGDAIQYLRDHRGLSFIEACDYLKHDPGPRPSNGARLAHPKWEPREAKSPTDSWQAKARAFLDGAVAYLWSRHGDDMRRWLRTEKGLSNATIKAAGVGFNPADIYEPRASWGLCPAINDKGNESRQWLPAGLVIPHIVGGTFHRLRVRRMTPDADPKYLIVSGSSPGPMVWNEKAAAVVVESELDGLLLNQEANDLVGVIALGSAQAKPDAIAHQILTRAQIILVALDSDEAGVKAAGSFWPATYGAKVKRWPPIGGKDPSEAWQKGLKIREWIVAGLFGTDMEVTG